MKFTIINNLFEKSCAQNTPLDAENSQQEGQAESPVVRVSSVHSRQNASAKQLSLQGLLLSFAPLTDMHMHYLRKDMAMQKRH